MTVRRTMLPPSLHICRGLVEVFHSGAAAPLSMSEGEACRALLAHADLLAACKALLDCAHDPECPNCQDAHRQGHAAIALAEKQP